MNNTIMNRLSRLVQLAEDNKVLIDKGKPFILVYPWSLLESKYDVAVYKNGIYDAYPDKYTFSLSELIELASNKNLPVYVEMGHCQEWLYVYNIYTKGYEEEQIENFKRVDISKHPTLILVENSPNIIELLKATPQSFLFSDRCKEFWKNMIEE